MNPAGPLSEELIDFIAVLRLNGYNVSTEQCIAAHKLLVTLASQGNWLEEPRRLGSLLAPILCTSREEQETFHQLYEQWLNSQQRLHAAPAEVRKAPSFTEPQKGKPESRFPSSRNAQRTGFIWLTIVLALLAMAIIPFISTPGQVRGKVVDEQGRPVANESVAVKLSTGGTELNVAVTDSNGEFHIIYNIYLAYYMLQWTPEVHVNRPGYSPFFKQLPNPDEFVEVRLSPTTPITPQATPASLTWLMLLQLLASVGALALLALMFARWRKRNRRMELKRWRASNRPRLNQLVIKEAAKQLASILPLRRTAQELRRHRQYNSYDLDVQRTVEETVRRGLFTPAYSPRKSLPEYLVLIDRAGFSDQRASLVNEIIEWFIAHDVLIERYYFQSDPRICRRDNPEAPRQTLQDLAAQYSERYLLVFSDAEGFFNPLTGRPQRWLEMFSFWETRVLLTPEFNLEDYRQRTLSTRGFKVLPANQSGLAALSETIHAGTKHDGVMGRVPKAPPALLWGRTGRWLEDTPPAPEDLEELCRQLKNFLGAQGYYWLSACAVYPLLHWDLTLHLGHKLISRTHFVEKFSTLMRLPWFHHGSIPDWLRIRLIEELSPAQEKAVRDELLKLLLTPQTGGSVLNIVSRPERSGRGWLERIWRKLSGVELDERRILLDYVETEPEGSVMRDYVLMDFMSGRKVNRLALIVPGELRRRFSLQKQPRWQLSNPEDEPARPAAVESNSAKTPAKFANALTLDKLSPGTWARVVAVSSESAYARRLMEMGFIPGASVHVVKSAPLGDPLEISVRNYHVALRRSEISILSVVVID
jgi:Fe2+ transport system protein FeoA